MFAPVRPLNRIERATRGARIRVSRTVTRACSDRRNLIGLLACATLSRLITGATVSAKSAVALWPVPLGAAATTEICFETVAC